LLILKRRVGYALGKAGKIENGTGVALKDLARHDCSGDETVA